MTRRYSTFAGVVFVVATAAFLATFADAAQLKKSRAAARIASAELAAHLGLTDLALFTEARYTRHPTQADLHSAFQDHPLAFDHFPTGSLLPPQAHAAVDREAAQPD